MSLTSNLLILVSLMWGVIMLCSGLYSLLVHTAEYITLNSNSKTWEPYTLPTYGVVATLIGVFIILVNIITVISQAAH
jgi:hypothetical protein